MSTNRLLPPALAATAALLLAGPVLAQGTFHNLGSGNTVSGLSADGSVAAGYGVSEYFYWTPGGGLVSVGGTVPGGGVGGQAAMSFDGTRFSGTALNPSSTLNEMSYYEIGSGWTYLGGIGGVSGTETSSGWGMSGDGLSVVGLGWISAGGAHAVQWESGGGVVDMGSTVVDRSTRANTVNADGTVVGGWQDSSTGFRQGAIWVNGVQTLIWNDVAMTQRLGEVSDVSDDGTWAVGGGVSINNWEAWRWSSATGAESFGHGPFDPTWRGTATAISGDGSVIVGFYRPFPAPATFGQGFIWTEDGGLQNLNTYVAAQGVDTGGLTLALPLAISQDGLAIAGLGSGGVGFVVSLDAGCPGDADDNGVVDVNDLNAVILDWGICPGCATDFNGDGRTDVNDLVDVITNWGACP